mgnify:FL=1
MQIFCPILDIVIIEHQNIGSRFRSHELSCTEVASFCAFDADIADVMHFIDGIDGLFVFEGFAYV